MSDIASISFRNNMDAQKVLLTWWRDLDAARGDRAELRRAATPAAVAFSPVFHRLLHSLQRIGRPSAESLAGVAGVLSHIKEHDGSGVFAAQMASPKAGGDRARVSGLRFRRLLKIPDREDLYQPLIRTVRLLDGRANLISLADGIYFWGENVRKQWAYSYYEKTPSES
jgi:CRISPR system Cascade subunit CasB